jgi:hypothetical protein
MILLALVSGELLTGAIGLMSGDASNEIVLQAHSILGYGIVVVLGWKSALALRSLKRPHLGRPRSVAVLLSALLLFALSIGIVWSVGGFWSIEGVTGMSLHIYAGAAIMPFIAWHAWAYTARFRTGYSTERRDALRFGSVLAAGTAAWLVSENLIHAFSTDGAHRRFTGSHERRSYEGNRFPTTSWLNDRPSVIDISNWRLKIVDVRGKSASLPLLELENGDLGKRYIDLDTTLDCTSGWYSEQVWSGVMLSDLIASTELDPAAQSCIIHSVTGYTRRYKASEFKQLMLATRVGGDPISHGHGAPLRLVAPGRRGYDWVKWVDEVRLVDSPHWLQPWLPLQ